MVQIKHCIYNKSDPKTIPAFCQKYNVGLYFLVWHKHKHILNKQKAGGGGTRNQMLSWEILPWLSFKSSSNASDLIYCEGQAQCRELSIVLENPEVVLIGFEWRHYSAFLIMFPPLRLILKMNYNSWAKELTPNHGWD